MNKQLSFYLELENQYIHDKKYYKTYLDLPKEYKQFIKDKMNNITTFYLHDLHKDVHYCPNCFSVLDDFRCNNCNIHFDEDCNVYLLHSREGYSYPMGFLFIECDSNNIYAYIVRYNMEYDKENNYMIKTPDKFSALLINDEELIDLCDGKQYLYRKDDKYDFSYSRNPFNFEHTNYDGVFITNTTIDYVYENNLNDLNNNRFFKYIDIDKYKTMLNKQFYKTIIDIVVHPIIYKEYEYLLDMELYNIIHYGIYLIKKGNSFKETFGVPKKYYEFMKNNNIDASNLVALRLYNTEDLDLLDFVSSIVRGYRYDNTDQYDWIIKLFNKDMNKFHNYINDNEIDMHDYIDYLNWAKQLGLDVKSNRIKYPKDFYKEHDKLYKEVIINDNKDINDKLIKISEQLKINTYEDDKYIIFPCYDIDSLLDESKQMHNCVRTYIDWIANHECEIYFMRYKDDKDTSLVTVEVRDGKVEQARRKFNRKITKEDRLFLDKFEMNYTKLIFE